LAHRCSVGCGGERRAPGVDDGRVVTGWGSGYSGPGSVGDETFPAVDANGCQVRSDSERADAWVAQVASLVRQMEGLRVAPGSGLQNVCRSRCWRCWLRSPRRRRSGSASRVWVITRKVLIVGPTYTTRSPGWGIFRARRCSIVQSSAVGSPACWCRSTGPVTTPGSSRPTGTRQLTMVNLARSVCPSQPCRALAAGGTVDQAHVIAESEKAPAYDPDAEPDPSLWTVIEGDTDVHPG